MEQSIVVPGSIDQTVIAERYVPIKRLGGGGAGVVFAAKDMADGERTVALKILLRSVLDDASMRKRFENEMEYTLRLHHPNIIEVYDYSHTKHGHPFIVMEYVDGYTLKDLIQFSDENITFRAKVRILRDIALGMAQAHDKNIIHRDLKPANILISEAGEIKIADFGLARDVQKGFTITSPDHTVGTPLYMSPEQVRGEKVTFKADIYALGVLAYEMVKKLPPFAADDLSTLMRMHCLKPLPFLEKAETGAPPWFACFTQVCTEKKPADRFSSMHEIATGLSRCLKENRAIFRVD